MRPYTMSFLAIGALALTCTSAGAGSLTLQQAITSGDADAVAQKISVGAPLDVLDAGGEPPLVAAALLGRTEIVRILLEAGVDSGTRTDRGLTALHAAAFVGNREIAELLLGANADPDDNSNRFGITPLHAAAEENYAEIVALFLAAGADFEITERNGYTPITRAGWREHWQIARMLKDAGASCQPEEIVGEWLYRHCNELPKKEDN